MGTQNTTRNTSFQDLMEESMRPEDEWFISRDLRGRKLLEHLEGYALTPLQKSILVGSILGDGALQRQKGNANFKMDQSAKHAPYLKFYYRVFLDIVGTPPKIRRGKTPSIWFRTFRTQELLYYYRQFYPKNIHGEHSKRVPRNIHRWLDETALAMWFQDDGAHSKQTAYYLNTQGFSLSDQKILRAALGKNFGLEVNIQKDSIYHRLYITSTSVERFEQLVRPYILPCMQYKLIER